MLQNNGSTIKTDLTFPSPSTLVLPDSPIVDSDKDYLDHKPMGILYHDADLHPDVLHKIKVRLNETFTYNKVFTEFGEFTSYFVPELIVQKIVFIICSKVANSLCGIAMQRRQCHCVYELQVESEPRTQLSSKPWRIFGCFNELFSQISRDMKTIDAYGYACESLPMSVQFNTVEESLSFSVFNSDAKEKSFRCLSTESLKFLLFYSCIEILTSVQHDSKALQNMVCYFRHCYKNDTVELEKIDDFNEKYHQTEAISYYTRASFVFRLVNQALRCEDIERIFQLRLFITDLHRQIDSYARNRQPTPHPSIIRIYRGKKLPVAILQQLYDNQKRLILMNGFVSTTQDVEIAHVYAGTDHQRDGYMSALFEFCIDTSITIRNPYTDITSLSNFTSEREILFSIGSIWFLQKMEWNDRYWTIHLRPSNELDTQLTELRNLTNDCNFLSIANILRVLGEHSSASNFYHRALEDSSINRETRGLVYYNIGLLAQKQRQYMVALYNFREAESLIATAAISYNAQLSDSRSLYAHNRLPSKLCLFYNIGQSYEKKGDYECADMYYQKALDEPDDSVEKAIVHDNLGLLEFGKGNYEQARWHHTQAVQLGRDHKLAKKFQENLNIVNNIFLIGKKSRK